MIRKNGFSKEVFLKNARFVVDPEEEVMIGQGLLKKFKYIGLLILEKNNL